MSSPCISSTKVSGTAVYNANGDKLGSIDDLIIDKVSGQVRYAALEFGGFLGLGTDRYPLPWSMLKYDTGFDGYVVPLHKEQLEKAPRMHGVACPSTPTTTAARSMTTTASVGNSRPETPFA